MSYKIIHMGMLGRRVVYVIQLIFFFFFRALIDSFLIQVKCYHKIADAKIIICSVAAYWPLWILRNGI